MRRPSLSLLTFFRNPEWDEERDAIGNAGHRFELIEVGRLPRKAANETGSNQLIKKKMGRPSKEAEIEEFVRDVLKDSRCPEIARPCVSAFGEVALDQGKTVDDGYSDSTIKRLIVRVLSRKDQLQKSKKSSFCDFCTFELRYLCD